MPQRSTVVRELDILAGIQLELAALATREDDRRKQDLIDLRRKLAAQIAKVDQLAQSVVAAAGDAALLETYRSKISNVRSLTAMHQAKWPAVALGERDDDYRASVEGVRVAHQAFVTWLRTVIPN